MFDQSPVSGFREQVIFVIILMDGRRFTIHDDGQRPVTIDHIQHFVLR